MSAHWSSNELHRTICTPSGPPFHLLLWSVSFISTGSAESIQIPSNSVDYIFVDPPFGANIMYSELNSLWEAWLKVSTDVKAEAVEKQVARKGA